MEMLHSSEEALYDITRRIYPPHAAWEDICGRVVKLSCLCFFSGDPHGFVVCLCVVVFHTNVLYVCKVIGRLAAFILLLDYSLCVLPTLYETACILLYSTRCSPCTSYVFSGIFGGSLSFARGKPCMYVTPSILEEARLSRGIIWYIFTNDGTWCFSGRLFFFDR